MAVDFTYQIGYMGVVKMADGKGESFPRVSILATGGNINIEQSPMYTTGVWGAGWYNAAQNIAYAPNYITTSGSINYELTAGNMFTTLQDFGFTKRNNGKYIIILPNGVAGYQGTGWCQGVSFSASADSLVTGDINFKTGNVEDCITSSSESFDAEAGKIGSGNLPDFGSDYLDVYPFWASGVLLGESETENLARGTDITVALRDDILDWNASYSSQLVLAATCANYTNLSQSQQAKYAALGTMTADGSFTIFRVAQDLTPTTIRKCRACTIQMGTAHEPAKKDSIKFGAVVFNSGSTDVQTGSSLVQSSFNFNALGNGTQPVMSLHKFGNN